MADNTSKDSKSMVSNGTFCEKVVLGKGAKVLVSGNALGCVLHILEEAEDYVDEKDDRTEV